VAVSTTLVHTPGFRRAKYSLAARTSSSDIALAMSIIAFARMPFLPPFLNSAIWRTRYVTGRPARLETRVAVSRGKMAERAGARRLSAGRDDLRHRRMLVGNQSGGLKPSSICACVYFFALPGTCFCAALSAGAGLGVAG